MYRFSVYSQYVVSLFFFCCYSTQSCHARRQKMRSLVLRAWQSSIRTLRVGKDTPENSQRRSTVKRSPSIPEPNYWEHDREELPDRKCNVNCKRWVVCWEAKDSIDAYQLGQIVQKQPPEPARKWETLLPRKKSSERWSKKQWSRACHWKLVYNCW